MYEVACSSCQAKQSTPFVRIGAVVDCPACNHRFRIEPGHVTRRMLVCDPVADAELAPPTPPPRQTAGRGESRGASSSRRPNGAAPANGGAGGAVAPARSRRGGGRIGRAASRRGHKGPDVALWTAIVSGVAMIVIVVALIARFMPGGPPAGVHVDEADPFAGRPMGPAPTDRDRDGEVPARTQRHDPEGRGPGPADQPVDQAPPREPVDPDGTPPRDDPQRPGELDPEPADIVPDPDIGPGNGAMVEDGVEVDVFTPPDGMRIERLFDPDTLFVEFPGPWQPIPVLAPDSALRPGPPWPREQVDDEADPWPVPPVLPAVPPQTDANGSPSGVADDDDADATAEEDNDTSAHANDDAGDQDNDLTDDQQPSPRPRR